MAFTRYFTPWAEQVKKTYSHTPDRSEQRLRCIPLVYQVGMIKCGTTDLYYNLMQHPLIQGGGYKEPHYWGHFRFTGQCVGETKCMCITSSQSVPIT